MNVCQSLICFFFLTLQDGNIGLINAEIIESRGTEGGNITVRCSFTFSGRRSIFCKDDCKDGDILIETKEDTAQRGRYSIENKKISKSSGTNLYLSITNLTQSDSGRYRCGLVRSFLFSPLYQEIEIRITDDLTLVLSVCVPVVVVVVVLLSAVLLFFYKKRTKHSYGSNQRGNTDITRTEINIYENCPPLSTRADSTYKSLDPASRDPDPIYSTLS
ncbi:uncharacterized protein LOC120558800 isoform X1 [Perca fluviatilis]|uniref:uncharacterized protein LOC120558800 isoform X1 n=1 Tax=Perca fluviatilis TaxID=8168 RepID=UPI0019655766|nr:uncharacterized protein LOC120558800 isoform X1 [Perca fluviatilis]